MSTQIEKLLAAARAEIGVKESPPNSNAVKYNDWYYGRKVSGSDYAWCGVFVLWCFYMAGLVALTWGTLNDAKRAIAEGAKNWRALALSRGQWVTGGYQPGDVVVYDWGKDGRIDHVGIVETVSADGRTLTCIEGNTAVGNDSNGGEVMRRNRVITYVVGAFRPAWEPSGDGTPPSGGVNSECNGEFPQGGFIPTEDDKSEGSPCGLTHGGKEEEVDMTKSEVMTLVHEAVAATRPKVYQTVDELPEWGRPTVQRLIGAGALKGDEHGLLSLSEDLLRALVIMERGSVSVDAPPNEQGPRAMAKPLRGERRSKQAASATSAANASVTEARGVWAHEREACEAD